ncbi:MAG TPA: hypothetical protein VIZ00_13190 [Streptosporangiaceae bacterium]
MFSGRISEVGTLVEARFPRTAARPAFVIVEAAYIGDAGAGAGAGAEIIKPLRGLGPERDTFAMISAPALGQLNMDPSFLLYAAGANATPDLAGPVRARAHAVKDALGPWHASYDYYNFEDTPATAAAVLPPASVRRLQEINAAYDPEQAIISAHPAWPSRPGSDAPRRRRP